MYPIMTTRLLYIWRATSSSNSDKVKVTVMVIYTSQQQMLVYRKFTATELAVWCYIIDNLHLSRVYIYRVNLFTESVATDEIHYQIIHL